MKIKENDKIPNSKIFVLEKGEPKKKNIEEILKDKKVVIFGLPGAYTSVCSAKHLPGYVNMHQKYKDKGIDHIICVSVNDPFVMNAWGKENNVDMSKFVHSGEKKKTYVKDMFNDISKRYDLFNLLSSMGLDRYWRYRLVRKFNLKQSDKLLDIATGTGDIALKFLKKKVLWKGFHL